MGVLGGLAVGLSIAFGVLAIVLVAEIYYIFCWKKQFLGGSSKKVEEGGGYGRKHGDDGGEEEEQGRKAYVHEAALVGSFGGYPGSPPHQAGFVAKLLFNHAALSLSPPPSQAAAAAAAAGVLFPIEEEVEMQDMESSISTANNAIVHDDGDEEDGHSTSSSSSPAASSSSSCYAFATPPTSPDPNPTPFATPPLRSPLQSLFDMSPLHPSLSTPPPPPLQRPHTTFTLPSFTSSFAALKAIWHQSPFV